MKNILRSLAITVVAVCVAGNMPFASAAELDVVQSPLIITEVQPGGAQSASQEFIEIYNQSEQPVDLRAQKWEVHIATSKATSWDKAKAVGLMGVLQPGGYMLLASNHVAEGETKSYLQDYASAQFSSGMTGSSGHVRIGYEQQGVFVVSSIVEWTTFNGAVAVSGGLNSAPVELEKAVPNGSSIKRLQDNGIFLASRFGVSSCPSPTAYNVEPTEAVEAPVPTSIDIQNPLCIEETLGPEDDDGEVLSPQYTPPATLLPAEAAETQSKASATLASNRGLRSPQLTELLPNPKTPQTDAEHEFIELYNENAAPFDLSGSQLLIGANSTRRYTFPNGTVIPARSFKVFFSVDTRLSLSNSGGQVALASPEGTILHKSDPYGTAKEGVAWAQGNGKWQWTAKPTPGAANAIAAPLAGSTKSKLKTSNSKVGSSATKTTGDTVAGQPLAGPAKQERPIHPVALAAVGVFAVLYGAYEYRRDVANRFYQLRSYRTARREARQELKG